MSVGKTKKDDWEKFLDSNYHQISRRIQVEKCITWLRSKSVLSQEDQEILLNTYCTQFLKAGHLIDIVKTKGKHGFAAFMEVLEYEYPELYNEITGEQPRDPPKDYDKKSTSGKRAGCESVVILTQMGDLIKEFTNQISDKKTELREFENKIENMKLNQTKLIEDQQIMNDYANQMNDKIQKLTAEKEEMSKILTKEQTEKEDLKKELETLKEKRFNAIYEISLQSLKPTLNDNAQQKAPLVSSRASISSTIDAGKVTNLRDKYDPEKNVKPAKPQKWSGDDAKLDEQKTTTTTQEDIQAKMQESNDKLRCYIEEFKQELEQSRLKAAAAEADARERCAEKEKLKIELKKMEEQFQLMADVIRGLKNEIDSRGKLNKQQSQSQKHKSDDPICLPIIFRELKENQDQPISPPVESFRKKGSGKQSADEKKSGLLSQIRMFSNNDSK